MQVATFDKRILDGQYFLPGVLRHPAVLKSIKLALAEDLDARADIENLLPELALGDITSQATIPENTTLEGHIFAKSQGVIAGLCIAKVVFYLLDEAIEFHPLVERDPESSHPGISDRKHSCRFLSQKKRNHTAPTAKDISMIGFSVNGLFLLRQVHRLGMQLAGEGGGASMSPLAPITLAVAGLVLACTQLPFLAKVLTPNLQTKALWILGSFAAYGGGWSGSAILLGTARPTPFHGALTGMISGITVLLLILVLEAEWRRPTAR